MLIMKLNGDSKNTNEIPRAIQFSYFWSNTEKSAGELDSEGEAVCLGFSSWLDTVRISTCGCLPSDYMAVDSLAHTVWLT